MMNKIKDPRLKRLWEYGMILFGSAIYAVGFNWCFQPNGISMGGFTGIAQIINRFIPAFPVGITAIVMNIPLFYLGFKLLGLKLLMGSLFAMTVSNLMIDGLAAVYTFQPMGDSLLAALYGGVFVGLSMGVLMVVGATTGGTELAARLLKFKLRHLSIGKLCMTIDVIVVCLYALTFKNLNNALYGIIAMYISSIVMDMVVYGADPAKMAYIISSKSQEVVGKLLEMNLGVTILDGKGAYTGKEKDVVLCAFKRTQIAAIKDRVTELDPNAFIIVCDTHEILGEGFARYDPDGL